MFEKLVAFLTGRISFHAQKGFQLLFLNACREEEIVLHNVCLSENGISAIIAYKEYEKLLRAAQKSGMELTEIKKTGLLPMINKHRSRIGIPCGFAAAAAVLFLLSGMLWSIDINGLQSINESQFRSFLSKNNIKTGIFLINVNCNEIERCAESY